MSEIFLGGSLAAAFFAGAVALFAPCCITVLFPAYLAAAVRNRRWRLVPLTFVFATGLAVVLVPITLGVGVLTESLLRFHSAVYALGGILMLGLAAVVVFGLHWSLPMFKNAPDLQRTDSGGVFALGVFSGAASACCAPVLAGVVTLSAVTPGTGSSITCCLRVWLAVRWSTGLAVVTPNAVSSISPWLNLATLIVLLAVVLLALSYRYQRWGRA